MILVPVVAGRNIKNAVVETLGNQTDGWKEDELDVYDVAAVGIIVNYCFEEFDKCIHLTS